ncbi:MAG: glutamine-hydrolyzing GMP synthase subunit GuaA [Candidatus Methanomethylophilaceae archaeon]|nr:glutamine-hydrolyzing GMP synthase subunit GuaA [Candidatus Methanomethylophilaceae archaeon]MBQ6547980.1 glutamine-hydrolyzing GMP synthase subunit GuaA [Candidatus Methanomethylophilaceae archaeon]
MLFKPDKFVDEQVQMVSDRIKGKAIIACSGGVDSMVAAVIVSKAIGDRLLAVYVDTGLMRKGETDEVRGMLQEMGLNFRIVDASKEYFDSLKGISEPEQKRKIIGEKFIRVFEREAKEFGAEYLVQGTIAPDWIESGDGVRDTIKSHHNVGGLPKDMGMELCEPLRDLYKDEVRAVARFLGIRASERQPFPGPALAVRCLGEVTPESVEIVREACFIVEDEIKKAVEAGKMEMPWQYFAVLLPSKSVGVQGDRRAYGRTIVIRSVESFDAMTAEYSRIPMDVLDKMSRRITNTMKDQVNRVVYDITNKPPATIEWE